MESSDEGFLIHRRRWRESSLILTLLTARHGLIGVIARGALSTTKSKQQITEFNCHFLAWSGRADLPYLRRAEALSRPIHLFGDRLISGLYLNELLTRLQQRHEPEPAVYAAYTAAVEALAHDTPLEPLLRKFEVELLAACGFALALELTADTWAPIEPERRYHYVPEQGALAHPTPGEGVAVGGGALLALAGRLPWNDAALSGAKTLMRQLLAHHLGSQPLRSRELFQYKQTDRG